MSDVVSKTAEVFTQNEALRFRDDVINKWRPQSHVWPFKYGDDFLACLTTFGSICIGYAFRRDLKLMPYARITCYMPVVGISSVSVYAIQNLLISSNILQSNRCPLCISTKSSILQAILAVGYPIVASAVTCFYTADRLLTYPVPPLVKAPREVFNLFKKILLKNSRPFLIIGAIHIFAASFITWQKQKTLLFLDLKTRRS